MVPSYCGHIMAIYKLAQFLELIFYNMHFMSDSLIKLQQGGFKTVPLFKLLQQFGSE